MAGNEHKVMPELSSCSLLCPRKRRIKNSSMDMKMQDS